MTKNIIIDSDLLENNNNELEENTNSDDNSDVILNKIVSGNAVLYFNTIDGNIMTTGTCFIVKGTNIITVETSSINYDTSIKLFRYLSYNTETKTLELTRVSEYNNTPTHLCIATIDANGNIICDSPYIINGERIGVVSEANQLIINFLGDSITLGRIANPDGTSAGVMDHPYCEYVAKRLNCKFINYGVGGSTIMAGTTGYEPMSERYSNMGNADIIFVFGGTNDYADSWKPCPLGNLTDMDKDSSFCGALNTLLKGLISKYPNSTILFATPLQRQGCRNTNIYGYKLEDYVNAIKTRCGNYSIPCLDLYNNGMLCPDLPYEKTAKTYDGLHPNENFHKNILSKIIYNFIKQYI